MEFFQQYLKSYKEVKPKPKGHIIGEVKNCNNSNSSYNNETHTNEKYIQKKIHKT